MTVDTNALILGLAMVAGVFFSFGLLVGHVRGTKTGIRQEKAREREAHAIKRREDRQQQIAREIRNALDGDSRYTAVEYKKVYDEVKTTNAVRVYRWGADGSQIDLVLIEVHLFSDAKRGEILLSFIGGEGDWYYSAKDDSVKVVIARTMEFLQRV